MVSLSLSMLASAGTAINASDVTTPDSELRVHIENLLNGVQTFDRSLWSTQNATIASGVVTATRDFMIVDTEGAIAYDDLDTINGYAEGRVLNIRMSSASRVVTLRHNVGNIQSWTGANIPLSHNKWTRLVGTSTGWSVSEPQTITTLYPRTALGSSATSIAINSIPSLYNHLMVVYELRTDYASQTDNVILRFNSDSTASNYYTQYMVFSGSAVTAAEVLGVTTTGILMPYVPGSTAPAGYGYGVVFITNYASTSVRRCAGYESAAQGGTTTGLIRNARGNGWWTNTSTAIDTITLLPQNGSNIVSGSAITLYGYR